jgi:hypothetical protein
MYFSTVSLQQVVPEFFSQPFVSIDELKKSVPDYTALVERFVTENELRIGIGKCDMTFDKISTMLFKKHVKYPNKEPANMRTFMHMYFENKFMFRFNNTSICNAAVIWQDAIRIMKEYTI